MSVLTPASEEDAQVGLTVPKPHSSSVSKAPLSHRGPVIWDCCVRTHCTVGPAFSCSAFGCQVQGRLSTWQRQRHEGLGQHLSTVPGPRGSGARGRGRQNETMMPPEHLTPSTWLVTKNPWRRRLSSLARPGAGARGWAHSKCPLLGSEGHTWCRTPGQVTMTGPAARPGPYTVIQRATLGRVTL